MLLQFALVVHNVTLHEYVSKTTCSDFLPIRVSMREIVKMNVRITQGKRSALTCETFFTNVLSSLQFCTHCWCHWYHLGIRAAHHNLWKLVQLFFAISFLWQVTKGRWGRSGWEVVKALKESPERLGQKVICMIRDAICTKSVCDFMTIVNLPLEICFEQRSNI